MFRLAFALLLSYTSTAIAQDVKYFYTKQTCGPVLEILAANVDEFDEMPLFTGTGITLDQNDIPYRGAGMFFVNQETGTWSFLTLYPDNTACITASGLDFEPYTD